MKYVASLLLSVLLLPFPSATGQMLTHVDGLGGIAFPNSGSPEAQDDFIRGVLLLHSFEYGPAAEAFRKAQEIDPRFAMAFWGEAMTYNHPLWRQKNVDAARAVLDCVMPVGNGENEKITEREQMYLAAARDLFRAGVSKEAQDLGYMDAMRSLHEAYPEDDEARVFYALSILGSRDGERDFATYVRAAATALPVFESNPNHPGAAHYVIHSFDDPVHAPLGLPAAEAYAEIAPNAAHAQHMTSHIFVAMGMWDRVVEANVRAQNLQDELRANSGLPPNACGHYSSWLHYGRLMTGELEATMTLMDACHDRVSSGDASEGEWYYFVVMRARQVVDTEDWSLTDRWRAEPEPWSDAALRGATGVFGGPSFTYRLTDAVADLNRGETSTAREFLQVDWHEYPGRDVQLLQLRGLLALHEGRPEEGFRLLEDAGSKEDAIPFEFGPPDIVLPGAELLGRMLLEAGRHGAADEVLRHALQRTPGRPLAIEALQTAQAALAGR